MKQYINLFILFLLTGTLFMGCSPTFIDNYDKAWKEVDEIMNEKPKTAISKIKDIRATAIRDKDEENELRAYCYLNQIDGSVECLNDLARFCEKTQNVALRSIAKYAMGQEMLTRLCDASYSTYEYESYPEDIDEWSFKMVLDTTDKLFREALAPADSLIKIDALGFRYLTQGGDDSRKYRPTLFDLLAYSIIEERRSFWFGDQDPYADTIIDQLIKFHANDKEADAYLYALMKKEHSISELYAMYDKHKEVEASNLILDKICNIEYDEDAEEDSTNLKLNHLLEEAFRKFPDYPHSELTKHYNKINETRVSYESPKIVQLGEKIPVKINYKNKKGTVSFSIFDASDRLVSKTSIELKQNKLGIPIDTTIELPAPKKFGEYKIHPAPCKDPEMEFTVSNLHPAILEKDKNCRIYAFDAKYGKPLKDVEVAISKIGAKGQIKFTTNEQGYIEYDLSKGTIKSYRLTLGEDNLLVNESIYGSGPAVEVDFDDETKSSTNVILITDRELYRPGQTVLYKCIVSENKKVKANKKIKVTLNHRSDESPDIKELGSQKLTTNEFGSASGSFILPDNIGNYVSLDAEGSHKIINIEEYKRPSFEFDIKELSQGYTFGDQIELSGTLTYLTGVPVANAKVAYELTSEILGSTSSDFIKQSQSDTLYTDNNGNFNFPFTPQSPSMKLEKHTCDVVHYGVHFTATDRNGETQDDYFYFYISKDPIILSMYFEESMAEMEMEHLNDVTVRALTASYIGVSTEVTVEIFQKGKFVAKETVKTNEYGNGHTHFDTKKWNSGRYKIKISAKDEKGRYAKEEYDIVLYRKTDSKPAIYKELMVIDDFHDEMDWNDTLHIRIGSSLTNQYAQYIIEDEFGIKEEKVILLNNEFKDINYPFTQENGKFLRINVLLIHDHTAYESSSECRKKDERKLEMEFYSFRDKTEPGKHEKWGISIQEKERPTEIVAFAYDKALDLLQKYEMSWSGLFPSKRKWVRAFYLWSLPFQYDWNRLSHDYYSEEEKRKSSGYRDWEFDELLQIPYKGDRLHRKSRTYAVACEEEKCCDVYCEEEIVVDGVIPPPPPPPSDSPEPKLKLRENFAETAFFFPHLKTDKEGKVTFEFTVPDQLTTWKFIAIAHTQDQHSGYLEREFISRKEFFISPNMPRFVRQGDRCCFSAKVSNLSENERSGQAILEIKDPASGKLIEKKTVNLRLSAEKTETVKWEINIPTDLDLMEVRTIIQSGNKTDGESHLLPVLSDRVLVTQSLPLTVRGNQTKLFSFDQLKQNHSETRQDKALTLEFCSNPTWYAVAALPSVTIPENECALCLANAYYGCVMAQGIANSNPRITQTIQTWKEKGNEGLQASELEKNPTVKNILLSESPWAVDAEREKRQRQELTLLFDADKQKEKQKDIFKRLNNLRKPNGAYSWFNGMNESKFITLGVIELLGRLKQLYPDLLSKGEIAQCHQSLQYLDERMQKEYKDLLKQKIKESHLDAEKLQLFYIHTLFPEYQITNECKESFNFYKKLIDKDWLDRGLYGQALIATILYRNGDKSTAKRIINSLREHSTTDEVLGMYWESNVAGYFFNESPIIIQALLLEAFHEIDPKKKELDDMRIWLLNQKRTQAWENGAATAHSIYALLSTGSNWLGKENKATISMGGKEIKPQQTESRTGYFTHKYEAQEITPALADIRVKKDGESLAWGAVHWQFTEKIENVSASKNDLEIKKTMNLERNEKNRKTLEPITEKTKLKVGDKVVIRLVIKSQREMEFVSLKDQKPACLEPTQQLSEYHWVKGIFYLQVPKDASINFFFEYLPKGTFVIEYPLWVSHAGEFTNGIATLQSLYAPAFVANSQGGEKLKITETEWNAHPAHSKK